MATDRRVDAYALATALNQTMLDETFRGNECDIHTVAVLSKTGTFNRTITITSPSTPGLITCDNHGLEEGDFFYISTTGTLPSPLNVIALYTVRNPTTNTFNVEFSGPLLNFSGPQSGTHTIEFTKTITIRFSDRAKYVGDRYYDGRAKFPDIKRTIGELVAPSIQFSEMEVELNNVDGFYNQYLAGGVQYFSFVGARLQILVGLRDVEATYFSMFDGFVPDEDGFSVERETITIRARDKADALNRATGLPTINDIDFPSAPQESYGKIIPMALGDWEAGYSVDADKGIVTVSSGGTQYDIITDAPSNFYGGIIGYPVGGGFFVFSIGSYTPDAINFCHIKRGTSLIRVAFNSVAQNAAGYWAVEITNYMKFGGGTLSYSFQDGDVASIGVKIPYAVGKYSNPIELAEQVLFTLGDVVSGDLDSTSWSALKTKSSPAQSDMTSVKQRIWIGEDSDKILEYTLQLLEQVRVELYWDNSQKIALRSMHPEDFPSQGSFRVEQIYMDEESIKVQSDQRNFFNKALGNYAYTPLLKKTQLQTPTRKNQTSINKTGKSVLKAIDLPSIYVANDAQLQLDEFLRLYSTGHEYVTVKTAWPTLLRDLGEIVMFNYIVGSINYDNRPMKIRDITFSPAEASIVFKLLSFANFPYTGNVPTNYEQMLSSSSQLITNA